MHKLYEATLQEIGSGDTWKASQWALNVEDARTLLDAFATERSATVISGLQEKACACDGEERCYFHKGIVSQVED